MRRRAVAPGAMLTERPSSRKAPVAEAENIPPPPRRGGRPSKPVDAGGPARTSSAPSPTTWIPRTPPRAAKAIAAWSRSIRTRSGRWTRTGKRSGGRWRGSSPRTPRGRASTRLSATDARSSSASSRTPAPPPPPPTRTTTTTTTTTTVGGGSRSRSPWCAGCGRSSARRARRRPRRRVRKWTRSKRCPSRAPRTRRSSPPFASRSIERARRWPPRWARYQPPRKTGTMRWRRCAWSSACSRRSECAFALALIRLGRNSGRVHVPGVHGGRRGSSRAGSRPRGDQRVSPRGRRAVRVPAGRDARARRVYRGGCHAVGGGGGRHATRDTNRQV